MRKLLLATVAALGASMAMAAYADAQVVDDTDGQSFPTPGTVTVRLNGRFREYAYVANQGSPRTTNFGVTGPNGTTSATGAAVGVTAITGGANEQGINKLNNYGFEGYARLYPGFDGVAANGLKYGASLEIRQDNAFAAGGGTDGSPSGADRDRGYLYLRREWGYIGTDRFGTVRFGSSDQPTSLFLTGTGENFDGGGLNGDISGFLPSDGGTYDYPFADVGNLYSTDKLVYLSPQFYGVDFGLSYEPSTAGIGNDQGAGCDSNGQITSGSTLITSAAGSVAQPGCDALGSTSTADVARRANTFEGLVRYRGTFGPIGVVGTASYDISGKVHDSGLVYAPSAFTAGLDADPKHVKYDDLGVFDFGTAITYGGFQVGGNYMRGRYTVPGGGGFGGLENAGQPDSNAFIVSTSYTIGPFIVGAAFSESWYEGNQTAATNASSYVNGPTPLTKGGVTGGQRRDLGIAAGGTYSLAPGVSLFLSGYYAEGRQKGYNFVTGGSNVGGAVDYNNKLTQSIFAIGTAFAW